MRFELLAAGVDTEERRALVASLRHAGHQVTSVTNAAELFAAARARKPDLLLLDARLDDMSGTELCRAVRAEPVTSELPIILMCDEHGDEIDRVVGFEVGADDVVARPYSLRELSLRIRAIARRRAVPKRSAPAAAIDVDTVERLVRVEGKPVVLTPREFRLFRVLYERRDRVQSREALVADVWDGSPIGSRAVDACVKRLREKLGPAGSYVQTVRGVGYRFSAE